MSDIGSFKAQAARKALLEANPGTRIEAVCERFTPANATQWVATADVVVDAADSFAVTYIASDECRLANKPLISASVLGLSGYVGSFCDGGPSYRAVFPEMPRQAGSCAQSGVLGTAVGVIGALQAHMVLGVLLDLQSCRHGHLIRVDLRTLRISDFSFAVAREPADAALTFIAAEQVADTDIVIDLRSFTEASLSPIAAALRIDVDALEHADTKLPIGRRIVLCCRTGVRAWRAARVLQQRGHRNVALIAFGD